MIVKKSISRNGSRLIDEEADVDDSDNVIIAYPINDDEYINIFPVFQNDAELLNYKRSKLAHCDVYAMVPVLVMYIGAFVTRGNISEIKTFGPYFSAALIVGVISFCIYVMIFLTMMTRHIFRNNTLSSYYMLSRRLLNSKFKHYFDEVLPLLVSTTTGLFLYARVRVGQCDNLKDIWHTQSCNPVADCLSIPHDQVLLTYMTPLIFQLVMKGVRFRMIILSWAVSTMFITISIVFARAWPQVWTIFYSFLFLFVLIESERLMRISFLQNKIVVHHESNRTALVETARQHARAIKKVSHSHKSND